MRCLLIVLLLAPLAGAQVAEDPAGDPAFETGDAQLTAPVLRSGDLRLLEVEENVDGFMVWVGVESTSGTGAATPADATFYDVAMDFHGHPYRLDMTFGPSGEVWPPSARVVDAAEERIIDRPVLQIEAERVGAFIERGLLRDRDGAEPGIGDTLDEVSVVARTVYIDQGASFIDHMPDTGTVSYEVAQGVPQTGHVRLGSPLPMRQSNGGAGTWVFGVTAVNSGDPDTFDLAVADAPEDWEMRLPFDVLELEGTQTFPVLVVTPFGHEHDDTQTFTVEAASRSDPSAVGRVALGIHYPQVPQPAGHHATLWLHSTDDPSGLDALVEPTSGWNPGLQAYMNALEADDNDAQIAVPAADSNLAVLEDALYQWDIPLSPSLQIGLDFMPGQMGSLTFPIHTTSPLMGATLHGSLLHVGEGTTVLADAPRVELGDLAADSDVIAELVLTPTPESDLVPFEDGAQMVLQVVLDQDTSAAEGPVRNPELMPGGVLHLPLAEYRDPVGGFLEIADGLRFDAGLSQSAVNPGRTTVVPLELHNDGEATEVHFDVVGLLAQWVEVPEPVRLEAGEHASIDVAIAAPADAANGTVAELIVTARSPDRPFDTALAKVIVQVDDTRDIEDQARRDVHKNAPGLGPLMLLAAIFLARRR